MCLDYLGSGLALERVEVGSPRSVPQFPQMCFPLSLLCRAPVGLWCGLGTPGANQQ